MWQGNSSGMVAGESEHNAIFLLQKYLLQLSQENASVTIQICD